MSTDTVERALERASPPLLAGDGLESALARREALCPWPCDDDLLRARLATIAAAQQDDGRWVGGSGALAATARALLELSELEDALAGGREGGGWGVSAAQAAPAAPAGGRAPSSAATRALPPATVGAGLAWLRGRRGLAGRYG
ncbi:MAG TPA: hypothetical protein VF832_18025, partial [Longimicrobiales bacterium]